MEFIDRSSFSNLDLKKYKHFSIFQPESNEIYKKINDVISKVINYKHNQEIKFKDFKLSFDMDDHKFYMGFHDERLPINNRYIELKPKQRNYYTEINNFDLIGKLEIEEHEVNYLNEIVKISFELPTYKKTIPSKIKVTKMVENRNAFGMILSSAPIEYEVSKEEIFNKINYEELIDLIRINYKNLVENLGRKKYEENNKHIKKVKELSL